MGSRIDSMREMIEIQGRNGTWNYDPYMHGLYNGMEYMLALAEGREPVFRDGPEKWLCDIDASGIDPVVETDSAS